MTIEDYIEKLRSNIADKIKYDGIKVMTIAAGDMAGKIVNRILTTGASSDGSVFSKYSKVWSDVREEKKLQVVYKDFQFHDGRDTMWANFGLTEIIDDGNFVVARIAGQTEFTQQKLNGNSWREYRNKGIKTSDALMTQTQRVKNLLGEKDDLDRRSIADPTYQEMKEQLDYIDRELTNILKKYLQ